MHKLGLYASSFKAAHIDLAQVKIRICSSLQHNDCILYIVVTHVYFELNLVMILSRAS